VISGLAIRTRSTVGDPTRRLRRNASRSSRLARLRRTAPPSFRLTASPRRSRPRSLAAATRRKSGPSTRFPRRKARWNSAGERRRCVGRSRAPPEGALCSDPLPSLPAAPIEDEATPLAPHADQKAVGPLPLPVVRLECPLHAGLPSSLGPHQKRPVPGKAISLLAGTASCQTRSAFAAALPCRDPRPCDSLACLEPRDPLPTFCRVQAGFSTDVEISVQKGLRTGNDAAETAVYTISS
jgi:hypothetical protein